MKSPIAIPGPIVRCRDCGMWFKDLTGVASIEDAYGDEYVDHADASELRDYMTSPSARKFFRQVLQKIKIDSGPAQPRLLDIGTGAGALLEEAQEMNYNAQGVEFSPGIAEEARRKGLKVRCLNAADIDEPDSYDVITMLDVIEHLPDPVPVLKTLRRCLKPHGELVVYTPNHKAAVVLLARMMAKVDMDYAVNEIFGSNHVCFFDDKSLPALLTAAGFKIRYLWNFPYDPRRPGQNISIINLAMITAVEWLGYPFGKVFRMVVYCRK